MKVVKRSLLVLALTVGAVSVAFAGGPAVGDQAPDFTLADQAGNRVHLAKLRGKVVVLEWVNPDCPFVQRHYRAGTMKKLAARWGERGVVWLAVNSTHYMDRAADGRFAGKHDIEYPILDDHLGKVGRQYGARTTPHMFIIDEHGVLVYRGGIDDDPRGRKGSAARNYVELALADLTAGRPVGSSDTTPYGCSVKYAK